MPRRRVKRNVKEAASSPGPGVEPQIQEQGKQVPLIDHEAGKAADETEKEIEKQVQLIDQEGEVEIEHSLTRLRLLRSYFSEEKLQTPVLQFFRENLPNLSIIKNSETGEFEVRWSDKDDNLSMSQAPNGRDLHASLLHGLSVAYPDCSANPSLSGFELSSNAVRTSLLGVDSLQMKDFVMEGPPDSQMFVDGLKTPGVTSQRMSIGMTPKTLRLPKPGEMLLSVRGSPLGVYKEDNMEAIHESEEG
ncbi:uncharacterized protein LOC8286273 isoform X2 [Ricinus communis]|uniref:uncharacterized protein LOC8286273 isoform X2 n=1 Tax=Ricinus communis TaxID=3988 RepID=UPI0007725F8F|nr:uncharacterized protein LOC8286273 isoform X2 [Ricinus communis]|eukprot:XP_015582631.1 uncharacterized protein LOC8286273 isoform X2 [Ricinus communis]